MKENTSLSETSNQSVEVYLLLVVMTDLGQTVGHHISVLPPCTYHTPHTDEQYETRSLAV